MKQDINADIDVSEWLLNNKSEIDYQIKLRSNPVFHLLPDSLYDIYILNYENLILSVIRTELQHPFQLNPEQLNSIITKELIQSLYGNSFFIPQQQIK